MTDGLKPCPFCGGEAIICENIDCAYVYCKKCGCQTDESHAIAIYAVEAWNTRYKRTCKVENTGFATGRCSACGVEFTASVVNNIPPDYVERAHFCPNCGAEVLDD